MDPWAVLEDEQRLQWVFTPLKGVGPLEFGMTPTEVETAVTDVLLAGIAGNHSPAGWTPMYGQLSRDHPSTGPWSDTDNATIYFDDSGRLAGVAVDALRGPQVRLGELVLVGQVPSRLDAQFEDYLVEHDMEACIGQEWNLSSQALGLVLRVQRAGDHLLTRPVMVAPEWADRCGDTQESLIPKMEWATR